MKEPQVALLEEPGKRFREEGLIFPCTWSTRRGLILSETKRQSCGASTRWLCVPRRVGVCCPRPWVFVLLCSLKQGWQAQAAADLIRCQQLVLSPDLPAGCEREQMGPGRAGGLVFTMLPHPIGVRSVAPQRRLDPDCLSINPSDELELCLPYVLFFFFLLLFLITDWLVKTDATRMCTKCTFGN